jgi:hypothetical protein
MKYMQKIHKAGWKAMVRWNIMIHYFITWFEYNDHYENCKSMYTWEGWNLDIKSKMCSENHRSSVAG